MKAMKSIYKGIARALYVTAIAFAAISMTSCDDYLGIKPKGQEIPSTLEDFTAFFNNESQMSTAHSFLTFHASYLFGEYYYSYISYYGETDFDYILYYWTDGNRYEGQSENQTFNRSYRGIAVCNQIMEGVAAADCSQADKDYLTASAKIIRVLHYFHMCSYFAHAYDPATADKELSVPFVENSGFDAPYSQPTMKFLFDWMVDELQWAIDCPSLPDFGKTILMPGKAAAYAAMARVQQYMGNHQAALENAEKALAINSDLVDWTKIYEENFEEYLNPFNSSNLMPSYLDHNCCENYYFAHGDYGVSRTARMQLLKEPAELFEKGDCFFDCNWNIAKKITNNKFYYSVSYGFRNLGGLRSVEQYLIKAESQARLGDIPGACKTLNHVRRHYIRPEYYEDFTASTLDEFMPKIRDFKHTTMIQSSVSLPDAKRLNAEGKWPFIARKSVKGKVQELDPNSHLYTFPFAKNIMTNTDGNIKQNEEY